MLAVVKFVYAVMCQFLIGTVLQEKEMKKEKRMIVRCQFLIGTVLHRRN